MATKSMRRQRKKIISLALDDMLMDPALNTEIVDNYVAKGTVTFNSDATMKDGRTIPISITVGKPIKKKASRTA